MTHSESIVTMWQAAIKPANAETIITELRTLAESLTELSAALETVENHYGIYDELRELAPELGPYAKRVAEIATVIEETPVLDSWNVAEWAGELDEMVESLEAIAE